MATPQPASIGAVINTSAGIIGVLIIIAAALLARRHLLTGRGDRRGAFRTAAIVFVCESAGLLVHARHYAWFDVESFRFGEIFATALFSASVLWILYVAFEPYVRRFWPQLLIGWTRLLSGRLRDPLVGRDVLVGAAAGTLAGLLVASREIVPHMLGTTPVAQLPPSTILLGTRYAISGALLMVLRAVRTSLQCVSVVVFLRIIVRRTWLVLVLSLVVILPIALSGTSASEQPMIELTIAIAGIALVLSVLLRFGLLSLCVMFYTLFTMELFPVTSDFSRPYAGAAAVLLLGVAAVSAFGFYASRGDEPLFGRVLLE